MLKRLNKLCASQSEMIDVYNKQIRCVLELAVALWTPGLTLVQQVRNLKRKLEVADRVLGEVKVAKGS